MDNIMEYDVVKFSQEMGVEIEELVGLFKEFFQEMAEEINLAKELVQNKDWDMLKK